MSEDKPRIIVTVLGEKLEVITPEYGWSFDEAILASDSSGGLGVAEIEGRMWAGDPRAWLAVLQVSYLRAERPFPEKEIGEVDMLALVEAMDKALQDAKGDSPPTEPSGNGSSSAAVPTGQESSGDPVSA